MIARILRRRSGLVDQRHDAEGEDDGAEAEAEEAVAGVGEVEVLAGDVAEAFEVDAGLGDKVVGKVIEDRAVSEIGMVQGTELLEEAGEPGEEEEHGGGVGGRETGEVGLWGRVGWARAGRRGLSRRGRAT